jgi:peptidoglycan/xylan/chitin deacetylase (PgdA/CDA1 family)
MPTPLGHLARRLARSRAQRLGWTLALLAGLLVGAGAWASLRPRGSTRQVGNLVLLSIPHSPQGALVRVQAPGRLVALSFDDGPDPRYTLETLHMLRRFGAHATFFVVGRNALARPDLVRAELGAGHEVANHTFNHVPLSALTPAAVEQEVVRGGQALEQVGAPRPLLFRAPYGEFVAPAGTASARAGELMAAWTVTVERAIRGRSPAHGVTWLMHRLEPGAIILAHDGRLNRARTLRTLPLLLARLHERGFRVVTIGELLRRAGELNSARWRSLALAPNSRVG